jgi:beta-glucosidase
MPYYGMPVGTEYDEVTFGHNKGIITDLPRGELGFDGISRIDWGLVKDATILGQPMPARAWGLEHLDGRAVARRDDLECRLRPARR